MPSRPKVAIAGRVRVTAHISRTLTRPPITIGEHPLFAPDIAPSSTTATTQYATRTPPGGLPLGESMATTTATNPTSSTWPNAVVGLKQQQQEGRGRWHSPGKRPDWPRSRAARLRSVPATSDLLRARTSTAVPRTMTAEHRHHTQAGQDHVGLDAGGVARGGEVRVGEPVVVERLSLEEREAGGGALAQSRRSSARW